jgi:tetratricopeptide (TPR) repeat protein
MKRLATILALILATGCAKQRPSSLPPATLPAQGSSRAETSLDAIEPQPTPFAAATTQEVLSEPPLEAIELFAKARGALNENQPFTAIQLLEKAIDLDPDSFELRMSLARAYAATNNQSDRVATALQAAAKLQPDSLEALSELGKAQFSSNQFQRAMQTLRLARATPDYRAGDDRAPLVDYYLARSLQQQGYDRAAIDVYREFLERVKYARPSMRVFPELSFFERRPEGIYNQIGRLYERLEDYESALKYFRLVAEKAPTDFAAQAQVVKTLLDLGKSAEAMRDARSMLQQFKASADSISLLRLVAKASGNESGVERELRQLLAKDTKNRAALFALSEMLQEAGKSTDAAQVLQDALDHDPAAIDILRRLFANAIASGDSSAGAKFLIERMTVSPSSFSSLSELWERLLNDPDLSPLTIASLLEIDLPDQHEGARQFWVSQMAQMSSRTMLSRSAMEKSIRSSPPFAPAFRTYVNQVFARGDLTPQQRIEQCDQLAALATKNGSESIAMQVEAQSLIVQNQLPAAIEKLAAAMKNDPSSADLAFNYASALRAAGQSDKAEQQLWKIISDFPSFPSGYQSLINLYIEKGNGQQAQRVMQMWLAADPEGTQPKLYEAAMYRLAQQFAASEGILTELLRREPWNSEVLTNIRGFFDMQKKPDEAIARFEDSLKRSPKNRLVLNQLLDLYNAQGRTADASRAIDSYVKAAGTDPRRLYYAAPAYREIGQRQQSDDILLRILKLDPRHPGANNDLGYNFADENRNVEEAESMVRIAIEQEPDNEAYLDSVGWVLYKRGRFEEARTFLQKAIVPGNRPDPQTLDHLGDVVYRLNDLASAKAQWTLARDLLAEILKVSTDRKDLLNLQLSLQNKLKQLESGAAVSVSPIVERTSNQASK